MQQLEVYLGAVLAENAKAGRWLKEGTTDFTPFDSFEGVTLPPGLRQLWSKFNGMDVPEGTLLKFAWLDGVFCYFSVTESASDYELALELWEKDRELENYWPRSFVPIGTPGDGSRLLVNCSEGSSTFGSVYELAHGLGVSRISASLSRYFETLNACVQKGAIVVTEDGEIFLDFEDFEQVGKQMNPECDRFT